jgi:hypothetical protein
MRSEKSFVSFLFSERSPDHSGDTNGSWKRLKDKEPEEGHGEREGNDSVQKVIILHG